MNATAPLFTVFTPTYNRAHSLERVYRSLLAQSCNDFEWLIVDDGSNDGTADLVRQWIAEACIATRYFYQPNSGKHVAFNRGVREARGELFLPLDSDDTCTPRALERLRWHWLAMPPSDRSRFSGVTALCADENGGILGGPLPQDSIDGRPFEVLSGLRRSAEMWGFHRTDVLRADPFPEYPGERFVPEALVWNRIGMKYLTRFVNEALRVYHYSPQSLSTATVRIRTLSPNATLAYYSEAMRLPVRTSLRLRAAANLWRFALRSRRIRVALCHVSKNPILTLAGLPPGLVLAWRDQRHVEPGVAPPDRRRMES